MMGCPVGKVCLRLWSGRCSAAAAAGAPEPACPRCPPPSPLPPCSPPCPPLPSPGYFCFSAGAGLATSLEVGGAASWLALARDSGALLKLAPAAALSLLITAVLKRVRSPFALPALLLATPLAFYATLAALGLSLDDARAAGWVAAPQPGDSAWQWWRAWRLYHWRGFPPTNILWSAMPAQVRWGGCPGCAAAAAAAAACWAALGMHAQLRRCPLGERSAGAPCCLPPISAATSWPHPAHRPASCWRSSSSSLLARAPGAQGQQGCSRVAAGVCRGTAGVLASAPCGAGPPPAVSHPLLPCARPSCQPPPGSSMDIAAIQADTPRELNYNTELVGAGGRAAVGSCGQMRWRLGARAGRRAPRRALTRLPAPRPAPLPPR